jgi:hypothetical protein
VQPAADGIALADRPGSAYQDEKGSLEGILGIVAVVQDTLANPQYHGAVAAQQGRERHLVTLTDECLQELAVGLVNGSLRGRDLVNEALDRTAGPLGHVTRSYGGKIIISAPGRDRASTFFSFP